MTINNFTFDTAPALYIVATPIGNLNDLSKRALLVLQNVDCIAAEDTRNSAKLLSFYKIKKPMVALHEHNERDKAQGLLESIKLQNKTLAVISDAGTPLISDPGYHIVRLAHEMEIKVVPIPGASATITALSVSGIPTNSFCFEGFLPAKKSAKRNSLEKLQKETRTMVFFETGPRLDSTLEIMLDIFGEKREVALARELTKLYETIYFGTLEKLAGFVKEKPEQHKGEIVLVVRGEQAKSCSSSPDIEEVKRILGILLQELSLKQAVKLSAEITGFKKNMVYDLALDINKLALEISKNDK